MFVESETPIFENNETKYAAPVLHVDPINFTKRLIHIFFVVILIGCILDGKTNTLSGVTN